MAVRTAAPALLLLTAAALLLTAAAVSGGKDGWRAAVGDCKTRLGYDDARMAKIKNKEDKEGGCCIMGCLMEKGECIKDGKVDVEKCAEVGGRICEHKKQKKPELDCDKWKADSRECAEKAAEKDAEDSCRKGEAYVGCLVAKYPKENDVQAEDTPE